jgi:hypothetical protein
MATTATEIEQLKCQLIQLQLAAPAPPPPPPQVEPKVNIDRILKPVSALKARDRFNSI